MRKQQETDIENEREALLEAEQTLPAFLLAALATEAPQLGHPQVVITTSREGTAGADPE